MFCPSGATILDLDTEFGPTVNKRFVIECIDNNARADFTNTLLEMRGRRLVAARSLNLAELCPGNVEEHAFDQISCSSQITVSCSM